MTGEKDKHEKLLTVTPGRALTCKEKLAFYVERKSSKIMAPSAQSTEHVIKGP